jgi:hypothetical protein
MLLFTPSDSCNFVVAKEIKPIPFGGKSGNGYRLMPFSNIK